MLKDPTPTQSSLEFVCINDLVPEDHLIRKIDKTIDFNFIHPLVKNHYCQGKSPVFTHGCRPKHEENSLIKEKLIKSNYF